MPSKKPTKQELGIPSTRQRDNLESIKGLARISQAHRVLRAAHRDDLQSKNNKQTQTDPEAFVEAEVVDSSDSEPEQEIGIIAEVIPVQEETFNLNRSFWILTGILLALWIRLLQ